MTSKADKTLGTMVAIPAFATRLLIALLSVVVIVDASKYPQSILVNTWELEHVADYASGTKTGHESGPDRDKEFVDTILAHGHGMQRHDAIRRLLVAVLGIEVKNTKMEQAIPISRISDSSIRHALARYHFLQTCEMVIKMAVKRKFVADGGYTTRLDEIRQHAESVSDKTPAILGYDCTYRPDRDHWYSVPPRRVRIDGTHTFSPADFVKLRLQVEKEIAGAVKEGNNPENLFAHRDSGPDLTPLEEITKALGSIRVAYTHSYGESEICVKSPTLASVYTAAHTEHRDSRARCFEAVAMEKVGALFDTIYKNSTKEVQLAIDGERGKVKKTKNALEKGVYGEAQGGANANALPWWSSIDELEADGCTMTMKSSNPVSINLFIAGFTASNLFVFVTAQFPPSRPVGLRPLVEYELDEIYAKCGFTGPRGKRDAAENTTKATPPLEERIIDGTPAGENEFPAAVYLRLSKADDPDGQFFFCGATLITRRHVITAQHCFTLMQPPFEHLDGAGRRQWTLDVYTGPGLCSLDGNKCTTIYHLTNTMTRRPWNYVYYPYRYDIFHDLAIIQLAFPLPDEPPGVKRFACLLPYNLRNFVEWPVEGTGWGAYERPLGVDQLPMGGPWQSNWGGTSAVLRRARYYADRRLDQDPDNDLCYNQPSTVCLRPGQRRQSMAGGDSGSGYYVNRPQTDRQRLLAVVHGCQRYQPEAVPGTSHSDFDPASGQRPPCSWIQVGQELTYRYVELCYYLNLCLPPMTQAMAAERARWVGGAGSPRMVLYHAIRASPGEMRA